MHQSHPSSFKHGWGVSGLSDVSGYKLYHGGVIVAGSFPEETTEM
jgi:hypothetical protein